MRLFYKYFVIAIGCWAMTAPGARAAQTLSPLLTTKEIAAAKKTFKRPGFAEPLPATLARSREAALLAKLRDWDAIQGNRFEDADLPRVTKSAAQMQDFPRWLTTRRRIESALSFTDPADLILAWFAVASPVTGKGDMLQADALIRKGIDNADQTEQMRTGWRRAWLSFEDEDVAMGRHAARLTDEDDAERARFLMAFEGYSAARRMLPRLPKDQRALLNARLKLRGFLAGVDAALIAVPPHLKNDSALALDRAYWRRQKGKEDGAIALLTPSLDAMALHRPERLWRERHFWARRLLREDKPERAYALTAPHGLRIDDADTSSRATKVRVAFADAEWISGWIALRFLDRPEQALVHFQRMYHNVATPVSRSRGAYWLGRASAALGDNQTARQWYQRAALYPHRYYGRLAAETLDAAPLAVTLDINAVAPENRDDSYTRFLSGALPHAARLLKDAGRNDLVGAFLSHIAWTQTSPEDVYLMSRFGAHIGRPDLPLRVAKKLEADGIVYRDAGYPSIKLPQKLKGKAALMHAIARQESAFDPTVVSRAGARGLMQLMPATAKRVARDNNMTYRYAALTADPSYNMALSSHYLDFLESEFKGAAPLMIASYNAGENAVARWVRTYGDPRASDVDAIDWMEMIPYSETRNYVQRVLEALVIYQARFGPENQGGLHSLLTAKADADG